MKQIVYVLIEQGTQKDDLPDVRGVFANAAAAIKALNTDLLEWHGDYSSTAVYAFEEDALACVRVEKNKKTVTTFMITHEEVVGAEQTARVGVTNDHA